MRDRQVLQAEVMSKVEAGRWTEVDTHSLMVELLLDIRDVLAQIRDQEQVPPDYGKEPKL